MSRTILTHQCQSLASEELIVVGLSRYILPQIPSPTAGCIDPFVRMVVVVGWTNIPKLSTETCAQMGSLIHGAGSLSLEFVEVNRGFSLSFRILRASLFRGRTLL